jgi:hypothetical protein
MSQETAPLQPHLDFHGTQSVAFLWHLSKDWDPRWGGAFCWSPSNAVEYGCCCSTFNTLLFFLPSAPPLVRAVTPVAENAKKGKGLALGGRCSTGGKKDNMPTVQDPIEDI